MMPMARRIVNDRPLAENSPWEGIINSKSPQGKMYIVSSARIDYPWDLANEKLFTLSSYFSPADFPFKTTPPSFLFLLHKVTFSFVCWTCLWLCHSLLILGCNSLLFSGKPVLAGQTAGSFILKANDIRCSVSSVKSHSCSDYHQ